MSLDENKPELPIELVDPLSDEGLENLVPTITKDTEGKRTLYEVRDIQKKHDELYADYFRRKLLLEKELEEKVLPLFKKRQETLSANDIPEFWYTVISNCSLINDNITERDALVLRNLTEISCESVSPKLDADGYEIKPEGGEDSPDGTSLPKYNFSEPANQKIELLPVGSFILTFRFKDNQFFENDVLRKTYVMQDDDTDELAEAHGCKILWKKGMDVTVRTLKKKAKNGRVLIRKETTDSFFNFFSPPKTPEEANGKEFDPAVIEELEDVMDADFEIGECIRSEIIPKALHYYLGTVEDENDDDSDDEDDDEEDDE